MPKLIEVENCLVAGHSLGPYTSLSASGRWAVARGRSRWITRWDCEQHVGDAVEGDWDDPSCAIALSSSGERLAILCASGVLFIRGTRTLNVITEVNLFTPFTPQCAARLSFGDTEDFVSACLRRKGAREYHLRHIDIRSRKVTSATALHVQDALPSTAHESKLTVATLDGIFILDDRAKLQPLWARKQESFKVERLSITGRFAVGYSSGHDSDSRYAVLDLTTPQPAFHHLQIEHEGALTAAAIADQTHLVLVGAKLGRLHVKRFSDGLDLGVHRADRSSLREIQVSSDGRTVLTAGLDSTRLWRVVA